MEKLKNKKLLMIVAVIFVVAAAVTAAVILSLSGKDDVSRALDLGDRYLSNMDYDSAIREYSRVLSIDPNNEDALAGIVMSYAGLGEKEKAKDLFTKYLPDTKRTDVLESYGKMLEDEGDYAGAVAIAEKLISLRDGDEDHEWMAEIIGKNGAARHDYSESTIVTVEVRDGAVNTMGSNKMGALGTDVNFGTDIAADTMAPAGFKGKAIGVYTFGSNTVVIDENNSLWIAGSSRSGQKTGSGTEMIVKAGWEDITPPDCKVIKAAGFDSTIFALTSDGKLWVTGQNCGFVNGDVWLDGWECITGYNTILDLQCSRYNVTFLNSDGTVYRASFGSVATNAGYVSASWYSAAKNVAAYSIGTNSGMVWCDSDGRFGSDNWSVYYPDSWNIVNAYGSTEGWGPQYSVDSIANVENGFYVLASDGVLHYVANGTDTEIQTPKAVEDIYVTGSSCVAELQGGGFVLFDNAGNQK